MIEIVSQLLSAFVGALGFALVFGMRKRYLFAASLGALLGWGCYAGWLAGSCRYNKKTFGLLEGDSLRIELARLIRCRGK